MFRNLPLNAGSPEFLLHLIMKETTWKQEHVSVWGKRHLQPRLIAWYGDAGKGYSYAGISLSPEPWTPTLLSIKTQIEEFSKSSFNSVLLNLYRNNNDSMGFHSDDEPELGARPTIASLSLGATRVFSMKPKHDDHSGSTKITLESGSLLVMKGDTQKNWKHGIAKESKPCGPRLNLTFRRIVG